MKDRYKETALAQQRPADIQGEWASLWRVPLPDPADRKVGQDAAVGIWLLHAPKAHPFWDYYAVFLIHLRPIEGFPDAEKVRPDAEYQVTVYSIDPTDSLPDMAAMSRGEAPEKIGMHLLQPSDFTAQFQDVGGDHNAYEIADEMCVNVTEGKLSPDQDYRVLWATMLTQKVMARVGGNKKGVH
jgi:hypothetical protein